MNGFFETEIEGVADECVTNADFVGPRNLLLIVFEILEAEVVTCIESETAPACFLRSRDEWCDSLLAVFAVA